MKKRTSTAIVDYHNRAGKTTTTKIRVYHPEGPFDRTYINPQQMIRWRDYYKKKGFKVRKL